MTIKVIRPFFLMGLLAGCMGPLTHVDTQSEAIVGFTEQAYAAVSAAGRFPSASVVFIRLRASQADDFTATELSISRLRPASKDEEILAYVADMNMILPAYSSMVTFNTPTRSFQCGFVPMEGIDKISGDQYHPCGSGSKLVVAGKRASAARNAFALVTTLGLASGIDYVVDAQRVIAILRKQGIMEKIKQYHSVLAAASQAESDVLKQDKVLQSTATAAIRVENNTGFETPAIAPRWINYTFGRDVSIPAPRTIALTSGDPFGSARADIDGRKAELLKNRTYRVACPANFSQGEFRGKIACTEVTEFAGSLAPQILVTLDSIDAGLRFPSFEGSDKNLLVHVADGAMVVSNLTQQYVEVQSIAVYGGKDIQENPLNLSLAPMVGNREPMRLRGLCNERIIQLFMLNGMRKKDLEKKVKFAIAIKYRVGDTGNFRTFYGERSVLLADLVSLR
jgi:hypothetical protein